MIDLIQLAAQIGGAGAVFGIIVFFIYRIDRKASEKRLSKLLEQDQLTRAENTKVLTELVTLLLRMNGNK